MSTGPVERYAPREITDLGVMDAGPLRLKVYGLMADDHVVTDAMIALAQSIANTQVVAKSEALGDGNGLGFVIIHPGALGLSISCHWWVQGCVLCQYFYRQLYGADAPMDDRPVIGCVWELGVIAAEQEAWRRWMMCDQPDARAYIAARASA